MDAVVAEQAEQGLLKDVEFYALDSRQESILWDVKPAFVVVYDPDVTFVRQLEVQLADAYTFALDHALAAMHTPVCQHGIIVCLLHACMSRNV